MSKKLTVYGGQLYHWGIKDMKWGRRRYQNEDGTYTEEGKERRRKEYSKEDIKNIKSLPQDVRSITESSKNILRKSSKPKKTFNLSKMSNQDLQNYINRYNLEQRYTEIKNAESVSKGKKVAMDILDYAGDVLAIGGSSLAIALSIKALRS